MIWPLPGTSISVYGTVDSTSGGVVTSYAVDGSSAYSAQVTSTAGSGDTYKQLFWASPTLGSGNQYVFTVLEPLLLSECYQPTPRQYGTTQS